MTKTDGKPMPITNAVYGKNRRKPKKDPSKEVPARRKVTSLVGQILGGDAVQDLYRSLGFTPPEDRPRQKRHARGRRP